jgi:CPA1 family monovalent cation:H+ antiporter
MAEANVVTLLALLIVVALVATAVQYVHIPYTVALVITGLALALVPGMPQLTLSPDVILIIFLPVLLFKGAFDLDLAEVRANLTPIILLSLPGVVATAGLAGLALHLIIGLPWDVALLFGAIIAATDPIAVLAIFGEVGAPRRLTTTVAAESLFNDGIALVLVAAILGIVTTHTFAITMTIEQFVVAAVGGLLLGVVVAVIGGVVLRHIDNALLETTITLIIAYGGYLLAVALHSSGPPETVMAALLLSARTRHVMSPTTRLQAGASWEFFDFLANSLLFLLVGLALHADGARLLARLGFELVWFVLVATLVIVGARGLIVWTIGRVMARLGTPWPKKWQLVITWAG